MSEFDHDESDESDENRAARELYEDAFNEGRSQGAADRDRLQAQVDGLVPWAEKAEHLWSCPFNFWQDDAKCTCGKAAALAAAKGPDDLVVIRIDPEKEKLVRAALAAREGSLCEGCPPYGYPTDVTRCEPCPRKAARGEGR
ncbi:MAG: hypothetical protein AB7P16_24920 [Bradyrhizobium sp.]|uniref:hypothetical protein n=1 Tax=Bradyrhizobium sp. TaxID=376 RepID=UPI003D0F9815